MAPEPAGAAAVLRPARVDEAGMLSDLALRSKAHWGYDEAFLQACRAELTVTARDIERDVVTVLERDGTVRGFYLLRAAQEPHAGEVEFLYVDPAAIGSGAGRSLWRHLLEAAAARGYRRLRIDADPQAEGFYRAMGARRIGEVPSGSIPGRLLPLLQFDLDQPEEPA